MNDMLRSPQLSAHMTRQIRSAGLTPMHGRPRSRTAPSTPLVEAPSALPVELPGCLPMDRKPYLSLRESADGKLAHVLVQSPGSAALGAAIARPHSSPQEQTHPLRSHPHASIESASHSPCLPPPPKLSPRSQSSSPNRGIGISLPNESGENTLIGHDTGSMTTSIKRPSFYALQSDPPNSSGLSISAPTSRAGSTNNVAKFSSSNVDNTHFPSDELHQADSEAFLIGQISALRASHEAHLNSLKETHEKEVASHCSYIAFLEKRRGFASAPTTQDDKNSLTLDTSHTLSRTGEFLGSEASATTLQSFESSLETQQRASLEAATGVEALKRKLSLCRKAQTDAVEVRRERDQLREAADRSDRRILQLKDIVRKAKENDKALKNANADLEARLVAANNERTDVLEGFHEACDQVHALAEKERVVSEELDDLRSRTFYTQAHPATEETAASPGRHEGVRHRHNRTRSDVVPISGRRDPLWQQLQDLRRRVAEKEAHIQQLQLKISHESHEAQSTQSAQLAMQTARISDLEGSLEKHKEMLATAQADSGRYHSLLYHEVRRQARSAAEKSLPATPNIQAEAFVVATETMIRLKAQTKSMSSETSSRSTATADTQSEHLAAILGKELEHCIKEIIMYK